jgi:hypothetical protein
VLISSKVFVSPKGFLEGALGIQGTVDDVVAIFISPKGLLERTLGYSEGQRLMHATMPIIISNELNAKGPYAGDPWRKIIT